MKSTARSAAVAAGLSVGLLLAGCGDSGGSDAASGAAAVQAKAFTGTPIKIFSIQQLTVTNQDATDEAAAAVKAAVRSINAGGGIAGHEVQVTVCDDKATPSEGAKCARQAVDGGFAAVVGSVTQQGAAVYPVLEKGGMCNLAPQAINAADYSSKASYPIISAGPVNVAGYSYALKAAGAKTMSAAYVDVPTAAGVVPFVDAGAKGSGVVVKQKVPIPITSTDISPVVASATRGVDGVGLLVQPGGLAAFLQKLAQSGSDVKVAASAADSKLLKQLGKAGDNLYVSAAFAPVSGNSAGMKAFNADMDKDAKGAERNAFSVNAWLGVHVLKEVIEGQSLTSVDKTSVCGALDKAVDIDLQGIAPKWSTNKPLPIQGLNRIFNPYIQVQKVEGGKLVAVDGTFLNPLDPSAKAPAL
jgi:branched-chain amino acid transport system substrate-binding protein